MHALYRPAAALATVLLGLMAGFFFAFAVDVAPAMAHLDGTLYVTTQQWINKVVRNAAFGSVYFGAALMPFVVVLLAAGTGRRRTALAWAVVAIVYGAAVFWLTRSVNVPINEAVALWDPAAPPANWAELRDAWNQANLWRALASAACFVAAVWLLSWPARPARATPTAPLPR